MERDLLVIALDISLSMQPYISSAVSGLNTFVNRLKQTDPDILVHVIKFNDEWSEALPVIEAINLPVFPDGQFYCHGTTSLHDFVYSYMLGSAKQQDPQSQRRTHFYMISDGDDNTSRTYNAKQVSDICKYATESCGWHFTHCGVDSVELIEHANHVRYDIDNIEDLMSGLGI
jgi:hypothetical protein